MIRPHCPAESNNLSMLAVAFGVHVTCTVCKHSCWCYHVELQDDMSWRCCSTGNKVIFNSATFFHLSGLWGLAFLRSIFFPLNNSERTGQHLHRQSAQLPESVFFLLFKQANAFTCAPTYMSLIFFIFRWLIRNRTRIWYMNKKKSLSQYVHY